jgi:hypothetical protein
MISSRLWIAMSIALCCRPALMAQSDTAAGGGSVPSSGSTAPTSSFSSTSSTPSTGASSSFGTPQSTGTGGSLFDIFSSGGGYTTESAPGFGASSAPSEAPPSFTLPGFYGQGSTTFFGGSGRLARPVFEMGISFSVGYDDNVFQTPSDSTPSIIPGGSQVIEPGEEAGVVVIGVIPARVGDGGVNIPERVIYGFRPATPETIRAEDLVIAPDERLGSFLTRSNLNLQMQRFTRRSLFTLDLSGGRTYYWDKDEDPIDYNAAFSASYLYKFTPRLQVSALFNSAYLSQPDLSRINTPDRPTRGDIINTLARADLSYRFTPRISTTVSTAYAGNRYMEKTEEIGNYDQWTMGLEARYLWKPRWTLLAEVRHATTTYEFNPQLDSTTEYLLVGSEFILNPRLSGSLRLGVNSKRFDVGSSQTAPYAESSVSYRSTARSSITWTNRFGFEEAGSPDEERLVYRSTIGYNYAFTPRLRGSANINLLHEITTNKVTNVEFAQDTFDSSIGLDYQVTRRFGLNASYSFTLVNSNTGLSDYYRNRVYFGGQISF